MTANKPITAKFIQGSIARHVSLMTLSSSVGLVGVFLVDLLDMYFLSLLGETELAAAVGYASSVTFFTTSICIGLAIASGIVTAKALGQGDTQQAKTKFVCALALSLFTTLILLLLVYPNMDYLLTALGATGKTHQYAHSYLAIILPAIPLLGAAMCFASALRGLGAAKNAMLITLGGALINAILDPIFIFTFGLGIEGAAIASAIARLSMFCIGVYLLHVKFDFFVSINLNILRRHINELLKLAIPAILTNQATPFANAYIIASIAEFGDDAVAGFAIIGRITPVAFSLVLSLSGAIGPVVGQNFGAKKFDRIKQAVNFSYAFVAAYVTLIWLGLMVLSNSIVTVFNANEQAASLLLLFTQITCLSYAFTGFGFVSNAVFNNLGKAHFSTIMNWAKATLGTLLFVYMGANLYASKGILIGHAIGNIVFGVISVIAIKRFLAVKLVAEDNTTKEEKPAS